MNRTLGRSFILLSLAFATASCEAATDFNPALDGALTDVLPCPICADTSVDANYDGPEVSIYGNPPGDAGLPSDAHASSDATVHGHD